MTPDRPTGSHVNQSSETFATSLRKQAAAE